MAVDPNWANVVLLCKFDGADTSTTFTDVSSSAHPLTATSATVSTAAPKFGTGAADVRSLTSSRIAIGGSVADFQFGSGPFTVETWGYVMSTPTGASRVIVGNILGSTNLGWNFALTTSGSNLTFNYSTTGTDSLTVSGVYTPAQNTWVHYAVDRDASNVVRVYADGVVIASATVSATLFASTAGWFIGNDGNNTRNFPGRLDEMRITKGVARYAGPFTPPTAEFPLGTDPNANIAGLVREALITTIPDLQLSAFAREVLLGTATALTVGALAREVLLVGDPVVTRPGQAAVAMNMG